MNYFVPPSHSQWGKIAVPVYNIIAEILTMQYAIVLQKVNVRIALRNL